MITYKVTLSGAKESGKSALLERLLWNTFSDDYRPTDKALFRTKKIDEDRVLHFFDVSGKKIFFDMAGWFCKGSHCVLYCINLSEPLNKEAVAKHFYQFKQNCPNAFIILVGTKNDIENQKVTEEQLKKIKNKYSELFSRIEIHVSSAKNDRNIAELTMMLEIEAQKLVLPPLTNIKKITSKQSPTFFKQEDTLFDKKMQLQSAHEPNYQKITELVNEYHNELTLFDLYGDSLEEKLQTFKDILIFNAGKISDERWDLFQFKFTFTLNNYSCSDKITDIVEKMKQ
ncbi:MAG: GTP-binding protein, partial [Legionella longbeachae]|nr:GTP-binding protein [Legionella longbeachae]